MFDLSEEISIQALLLLPVLFILFILFVYLSMLFHIPFVHFYPFFIIFIIITSFSYNRLATMGVVSFISIIGLFALVLVDGVDKVIVIIEMCIIWGVFFLLAKYETQHENNVNYLHTIFDEIEENNDNEYVEYLKDMELLESIKSRLIKYNNLNLVANKFTGVLDLAEIEQLLLDAVQNIVDCDSVKLVNNDDNLFITWAKKQEVPLFIEDLDADYRFSHKASKTSHYKSIMIIPIWKEHNLYSFVEIKSIMPNVFKEEDLRMIIIICDIASVAITNAMLFRKKQELVIVDGLTNIFNRRYFLEIFSEEMDRANRYNLSFSLLMIDIDYFKHFNDTHGHVAGDKILRLVAKSLKNSVRETDVVARYGGEEFCVLLTMAKLDDAYKKAKSILEKIEYNCGVTVSIGVATKGQKKTMEEVIAAADDAMYRSKEKGRNKVVSEQC